MQHFYEDTWQSKLVLDYVKAHDGEDFTATDIATATGLEVKSVNSIIILTFQKKGLMEYVPAEIELPDGSHKAVKFIRLTRVGRMIPSFLLMTVTAMR